MFDPNAFYELVRDRGVKMTAIAAALGISTPTLYRKLNGQSEFTRSEIQRCCEFFHEPNLNGIFFANKVSQT